MTHCNHYRLAHTRGNPRYNGSHSVTHYFCYGPLDCPHRDGSLEACSVKGEKPEALEVAV